MPNMSYCRFQDTLLDLCVCADHLHDNDLNDKEKYARQRLIKLCQQIADESQEEIETEWEDEEGEPTC